MGALHVGCIQIARTPRKSFSEGTYAERSPSFWKSAFQEPLTNASLYDEEGSRLLGFLWGFVLAQVFALAGAMYFLAEAAWSQ